MIMKEILGKEQNGRVSNPNPTILPPAQRQRANGDSGRTRVLPGEKRDLPHAVRATLGEGYLFFLSKAPTSKDPIPAIPVTDTAPVSGNSLGSPSP